MNSCSVLIPKIRLFSALDRGACIAIFVSNLPLYFGGEEQAEFEEFLDNPRGEYHVVEVDGVVAACGGLYVCGDAGRLSWGMVDRKNHGSSIGKFLLAERVNRLFKQADVSKITIDTSQHAAGFFARHGFCTTQRISDGFGPGIDQVSMSLHREAWIERTGDPLQPRPSRGAV